jgi:hypothetical protein
MSNRRTLIAAFLAALAAGPALANEGGKPSEAGQYVDLAPVALPVVVDGRLVNYVFVYVRVNLTSGANSPKLREREPYFRDALVRAGHRTPFTRYDDYTILDVAKLKAAMFSASVAIAGPGAVKSIEVTSQTPKRRTGLPKPRLAASR